MTHIPGLRRILRVVTGRARVREDVDDELRFHLELATREFMDAGLDPVDARAAAARRFGDVGRVAEACRDIGERHARDVRRAEVIDIMRQDLTYAVRRLAKMPAFTALVVSTLALGIGFNTAIFSVVNSVLLEPLPYPDPERLVRVWSSNPAQGFVQASVSVPDLRDWRERNRVFDGLTAYSTLPTGLTLTGRGEAELLPTAFVAEDFFAVLGAAPTLGRPFLAEEHVDGNNRVVVISHTLWRSRFGADPALIGRTITLNEAPFIVVGIMPPRFGFPSPDVLLWTPTTVVPETGIPRTRQVRWLDVLGRLAPGVSTDRANAEMTDIARRLEAENPDVNAGWARAVVKPLREHLVGDVRRLLLVLLGAVGFVLLIACVNVANLLLAQGTARAREVAVRAALGAGRARIVRQLLTESVVLALAGGVLGVLLAGWSTRVLVAMSAGALPRAHEVATDGRVLAFALGISLVTALLFGLAPAVRTARMSTVELLKDGGKGTGASRGAHRAREALVASEVALALVLVAGAGLMIKSVWRLTRLDPGFATERTLAVRFTIPNSRYPTSAQFLPFAREAEERIRALPGVVAVGAMKDAPLRNVGEQVDYRLPGHPEPRQGEEPVARIHPVSPGLFEALRVPLVRGRGITEQDLVVDPGTGASAPVVVINQSLARRAWPNADPVGQRLGLGAGELEVVGVVGDVRHGELGAPPEPTVYVAPTRMTRRIVTLIVRTRSDPVAVAPAIRATLRTMDPAIPIASLAPMTELLSESTARPRLFTALLGVFGAFALLLAAVGLYGVLAYAVSQRRREIGVRMALGARERDVVLLTMRRGLLPVAVGLLVGLVAAGALTRILASLLFEVPPTDAMTFALTAVLMVTMGVIASFVPARRAARVDPAVALRSE